MQMTGHRDRAGREPSSPSEHAPAWRITKKAAKPIFYSLAMNVFVSPLFAREGLGEAWNPGVTVFWF